MEFIVEQQAKFAAEMEIMREAQAAETKLRKEQQGRLSDALLGVVDIVGSLTRSQIRTEENLKLLTDSQVRTDERLSVFINVVERYISGNVGSESHA